MTNRVTDHASAPAMSGTVTTRNSSSSIIKDPAYKPGLVVCLKRNLTQKGRGKWATHPLEDAVPVQGAIGTSEIRGTLGMTVGVGKAHTDLVPVPSLGFQFPISNGGVYQGGASHSGVLRPFQSTPAYTKQKGKATESQEWIPITNAGVTTMIPYVPNYFPYHGPVPANKRHMLQPRDSPVPEFDCLTQTSCPVKEEVDPKYMTFTCFGRLPKELRDMIVQAAMIDRRISIKLKYFFGRDYHATRAWKTQKFIPNIQPPSLLFVNHEIREHALKKYKPFFGIDGPEFTFNDNTTNTEVVIPHRRAPAKIPFDPKTDTVVIELPDGSKMNGRYDRVGGRRFFQAVSEIPRQERKAIQKLAVRYDAFPINPHRQESHPWKFHQSISKFPKLRQLDLQVPYYIGDSSYPWKDENPLMGNLVRGEIRVYKSQCEGITAETEDLESGLHVPEFPDWKPPVTVRVVQMGDDGQPSYKGYEEIMLLRENNLDAYKKAKKASRVEQETKAAKLAADHEEFSQHGSGNMW